MSTILLLLIGAGPVEAKDDTNCLATESGQKPVPWLYPNALPDRSKPGTVPPLAAVKNQGAFVMFDEVLYNGSSTVHSFIVMLGSKQSFAEFGSLNFAITGNRYAEILGRVQQPDGTTRELTHADMQCKVTRYDNIGFNAGKSQVPKQYIVNFPGLTSGAIIQYQIAFRYHGLIDLNWLYAYSNLFTLKSGGQTALLDDYDPFRDAKLGYPAAMLRYTFILPKGMKFEYKVEPPDPSVHIVESKGPDSYMDRVVQITSQRAALNEEPYAPAVAAQSPVLITYVRSTERTSMTEYLYAPKDWNEWINREASDPLQNIVNDSAALTAVLAASPLPAGADRQARADALNRFMRDRVTNATGNELRFEDGYRPPLDMVSRARTGTIIEKALGLASLLKTAGFPAYLVYARNSYLPPMDKAYTMIDWFWGNYLVAADIDGKRVYYDPHDPVPSGTLPYYLQGGEALLMKDRKTWEWVTLPKSTLEDNLDRLELRVDAAEGGTVTGSAALSVGGAFAARLRTLKTLTPEYLRQYLLGRLDGYARQGVSFTEAEIFGINDPDQPLSITAKFQFSGGVAALGQKKRLIPLPARNGPRPADFSANGRQQAFDFRTPLRFETVVHYSEKFKPLEALPAAAELSAEGMKYRLEFKPEGEGFAVRRAIDASGMIPAEKSPALQRLVSEMDAHDNVVLTVKVQP